MSGFLLLWDRVSLPVQTAMPRMAALLVSSKVAGSTVVLPSMTLPLPPNLLKKSSNRYSAQPSPQVLTEVATLFLSTSLVISRQPSGMTDLL